MSSNQQQSNFKKNRHFRFNVDSVLNENKSLSDEDICILDEVNPPQVWGIKLANQNFTEVSLVKIGSSQWLNLGKLNLEGNKIRTIGCKYLSQIEMPKINEIVMTQNQVSSPGVHHLVKGNWPQLSLLQVEFDCLHSKVIANVAKGNWPKLQRLDVRQPKPNEISLLTYWELITLHRAESLKCINIGKKKLSVAKFYHRLLTKVKKQADVKVVALMKKKFVKLSQNYDL